MEAGQRHAEMSPAPDLAMGATVEHVGSHIVCIRTLFNVNEPTAVSHARDSGALG